MVAAVKLRITTGILHDSDRGNNRRRNNGILFQQVFA
jgi:hypothetical protein